MSTSDDVAAVRAAIDRVRGEALREFGWTHLDLEVDAGTPVVVRGVVAARGAIARIARACPPTVALDVSRVSVLSTGALFELPQSGATLHRRPDRLEAATLTTELDQTDGPVERLEQLSAATLVRASDGTVGWTAAPLGPAATWPSTPIEVADRLAPIAAAWASWLGVPYKLGGTRAEGIDCSGLVARLLATAGLRVPRHSADQVAVAPHDGAPQGPGDIVAIWSHDEAPCHVGLAIAGDQVVHASRSRACVVVEPVADLVGRASKVMHVPLSSVVELGQRARDVFDLLSIVRGAVTV